jgi:hypothetical protein
MSPEQRSRTFVDSKVQGALARRIIYHWLVFLLVASLTAFLLQVLSNPFLAMSEHVKDLWWTHGPFLFVLVFLLPVFVIDTIRLSHHFVGPMLSLDRAMRDVADGKPPRKLCFRRDDFWRGLADDYNAMIEHLAPDAKNTDEIDADGELVAAAD